MSVVPPYFNDKWTLEDAFGMAAGGDHLARVLLDVPPPFAARVAGKWGSGKTSILRRAFATLGGTPIAKAVPLGDENAEEGGLSELVFDARCREGQSKPLDPALPLLDWDKPLRDKAHGSLCIWYSPWQHQNHHNPLLPLLEEIKAQFSTWMRLKENAKKFNRKGGLAALSLLEKAADLAMTLVFQKNISVVSGTTDKLREIWREGDNPMEKPGDGQRFHLLFEDAVNMVLEAKQAEMEGQAGNDARLIIFIDDLDRCEEAVAVNLLECIKLYLNTRNCVFVLGMDNAALLGILARHWPKRAKSANREYLEKLFQMTLAVPTPDPAMVQGVLARQLANHGLSPEEADDCSRKIVELLEPNPRKLKNFTNSYCGALGLTLPHMKDRDVELFHLMVCQYLRQFHGPIWRLIEREPWVFQLLSIVINRITGVNPAALADDEIGRSSMGLIRLMIKRHFIHVLEDEKEETLDIERFHSMNMDDAVIHILDNLDHRRSDKVLRKMMQTYGMNEHYLPQKYILQNVAKTEELPREPEQP